jgi:hypothetical protein
MILNIKRREAGSERERKSERETDCQMFKKDYTMVLVYIIKITFENYCLLGYDVM